jgi:hypothetical protein
MFAYPLRTAALAAAALIGLSACTTPYGYGGVSVGNSYGYDPYYGGYGYGAGYPAYGYGYPDYGYGYGYGSGYAPYWGWNDGFYYPGTGYYVYDRYRRPYRWTDAQRRYWEARRARIQNGSNKSLPQIIRENWGDFDRKGGAVVTNRVDSRQIDAVRDGRPVRVERNTTRTERSRPQRVERSTTRTERSRAMRTEQRSGKVERQSARDNDQSTRGERRSEVRSSSNRSERAGRSNGRRIRTAEE